MARETIEGGTGPEPAPAVVEVPVEIVTGREAAATVQAGPAGVCPGRQAGRGRGEQPCEPDDGAVTDRAPAGETDERTERDEAPADETDEGSKRRFPVVWS